MAKSAVTGALFLRFRRARQEADLCRRWVHRKKIFGANWILKGLAGKPTGWMEREAVKGIVAGVRGFANTETFEHVVGAAIHKRSHLKFKMPGRKAAAKKRIHWGSVDVLS